MYKISTSESSAEGDAFPSDGGRARVKVPSREVFIIVTIHASCHVGRMFS